MTPRCLSKKTRLVLSGFFFALLAIKDHLVHQPRDHSCAGACGVVIERVELVNTKDGFLAATASEVEVEGDELADELDREAPVVRGTHGPHLAGGERVAVEAEDDDLALAQLRLELQESLPHQCAALAVVARDDVHPRPSRESALRARGVGEGVDAELVEPKGRALRLRETTKGVAGVGPVIGARIEVGVDVQHAHRSRAEGLEQRKYVVVATAEVEHRRAAHEAFQPGALCLLQIFERARRLSHREALVVKALLRLRARRARQSFKRI